MKKLFFVFLLILSIIFLPSVNASSIDTSINCPSTVYVGDGISCTIYGIASDVYLSGIKANYEIANASYTSFSVGSDWVAYASNNNGFVIGNTSGGKTGRVVLGVLKVQPTVGVSGRVTVGIKTVNASDVSYNDYDLAARSSVVTIVERPKPPTPTPTPSTPTPTPTPSTPTPTPTPSTPTTPQNPQQPEKQEDVYLDSLEVVESKLDFKKDVYEYLVEVNENVREITIKATSKFNIEGTGKFKLNSTTNQFLVKVKGKKKTKTYTIRINKVSNKVKNNKEEIEKALTKYDTVIVDLDNKKDDLKAYKEVLDKVKETKKKIIYNIYDNNKLLYTYTFNGNKVDYVLDNIDLSISFTTNKNIDNLENNKIILDMKYKSYFPKGTELKIYDTKKLKNKSIKLFKINEENGLELIKNNINTKDNDVTLILEKGDLYVIGSEKSTILGYEKMVIVQAILIIIILLALIYFMIKCSHLRKDDSEIS